MARNARARFSENLRRVRGEVGLTQEELGARSGVQMADISRYEGGHRDPRLSTIERLAIALDVPLCELVGGD